MKRLISIVFFIGLVNIVFAQSYLCLARQSGSKNWGYINEKGNFVIQPRTGKCMEFSEDGIAVVLPLESKQYSFITSDGNPLQTEITSFKLIEILGFGIKGFHNGMVPVKVGEVWGFLNTKGKVAIQPKYDDVTEFYEGFAAAKRGNSFYVLSKNGTETAIAIDQVKDVKHFSEGLAPFYTINKRAGFIDSKGAVIISADYQTVGYFSAGLAWVKTTDGKVGYINKEGAWVINPTYDVAKEFDPSTKMALVRTGKVWSYINTKGEALSMNLDGYGDFVEGLCWGKQGAKIGFFDKAGNWIISPKFEAVRDFRNGYAAAKEGELWGIIDKKGNWVIQPQFDGIRDMEWVN